MGKEILTARRLPALLLAACLAAPATAQEPAPAAGEAARQTAGEAAPQTAGEAAEQTPPAPPPGPVVTAIEVRSETPLEDPADLEQMLAIEVGQPLDDEQVRRTLRNVQASGLASEVELYTRPAEPGPGVVVVLAMRAQVRVSEVRIEGELGVRRVELARVLPQREAEPLSEERVLRGIYNLQSLYRESGYLEPEVRIDVAVDEESRQAVVTYQVDSGPRARVRQIGFEGETAPFTPAQLLEPLEVKPGEPFAQRAAREDAERLQRWLVRRDHRLADVGVPACARPPDEDDDEALAAPIPAACAYDPATDTVALSYPVEVGPRLEVVVEGADRKKLEKQDLLPFLGDAGYDEALLLQAEERIRTWYQQEGHYKVEVDLEQQRQDGVLRVAIAVRPGPVYTLRGIDFTGNEAASDEELSQIMVTAERGLLSRVGLGSGGRLVEAELAEDLDAIRSWYALRGFSAVEVGPQRVEERGEELYLEIPIVEGPQQRVVELALEGVEALDAGDLRQALPLEENGPFHPVLLEDALDVVRARYAALGFDEAQVSAREEWNEDHTLVDVTISVLEGPQMVLDRIIVRGNRRTRPDVIRRTLGIERGEPISQNRLLEIERDLYQLGIFSRVDASLTRAGLGAPTRDLVVRVEEGRPRRQTYGVGWDSDDGVRGSFGFSHNNVLGRAYRLHTNVLASEAVQSGRVAFDQPYLFDYPVQLLTTLFYLEEDNEGFFVEKWGGRAEAVRTYGDRRVGLAFDYRIVELTLEPGLLGEDRPEREDQNIRIASLIPSVLWERRDDPINATQGWSTLAQLEYAFPLLSADADFAKLLVQQINYAGLGRLGVLAGSLRLGAIEPIGALRVDGCDVPAGFPTCDVPIDERFFSGIAHRAYRDDRLGIPGETLIFSRDPNDPDDAGSFRPAGGNGLFLLNLDYRFPIAGAFGGTLFVDGGNIWADWQDVDPGELKWGVGAGVRYLSPIGPLRVDIGFQLDREPFEEHGWALTFSFGNPF